MESKAKERKEKEEGVQLSRAYIQLYGSRAVALAVRHVGGFGQSQTSRSCDGSANQCRIP